MSQLKFILASGSPRRSDLLKQIGISFKIIRPELKEVLNQGESPDESVQRLALEKGQWVFDQQNWSQADELILMAADTIVVAPDKQRILGKPKNQDDAVKMLKIIQGYEHTVYTGYALIKVENSLISKKIVRSVATQVTIRKLNQDQIKDYVDSGEPMDKAGAYAAQGIGVGLVESIKGSYSGVVGLPVAQLIEDLENEFGYTVRLSKNQNTNF